MVDERELSSMEHEVDLIRGLTDMDFGLIAVCVDDWNKDLSPWQAPPVYGNEDFGSGADETLSWVLNNVIFGANAEEGDKRRYILGGYSLAGLFALYSAYKTNVFEGIAAASPSVWFPGFTEYAKENEINCLYVLKLTRHRGIGTYLFTQSVSALLKRYKNVRVSETLYQDRKILQDFINIFDHKNYVFLDLNIKGNPNCRTN